MRKGLNAKSNNLKRLRVTKFVSKDHRMTEYKTLISISSCEQRNKTERNHKNIITVKKTTIQKFNFDIRDETSLP